MTTLHGLMPHEYEHPFDQKTLAILKKVPVLDSVINFIMDWTVVKWELMRYQGSYFNINEDSCPGLYKQFQNVANTLDVIQMPTIYTEWSYLINGFTMGDKNTTMLAINTGAVDLMTEKELAFIIGHEMGHIKSRHFVFHQMLWYLSDLIPFFNGIEPLVKLPLLKWYRMSEFTADRAGLLACQDINAALSALTKMGGIPQKYFGEVSNEAIMQQARDFEKEAENLLDSFLKAGIKTISILESTHPWTVLRASELLKWYESGEYQAIIDNHEGNTCPVCHHSVPRDLDVCPFCGSKI